MPHCLPLEPASASCPPSPGLPGGGKGNFAVPLGEAKLPLLPLGAGPRSTPSFARVTGGVGRGVTWATAGIVVGGSVLVMYGRAEQGIACDVRLIIQ